MAADCHVEEARTNQCPSQKAMRRLTSRIIYREAPLEFLPMATLDLAERLAERLTYYLARCGLMSGRSRALSVWKTFKR